MTEAGGYVCLRFLVASFSVATTLGILGIFFMKINVIPI